MHLGKDNTIFKAASRGGGDVLQFDTHLAIYALVDDFLSALQLDATFSSNGSRFTPVLLARTNCCCDSETQSFAQH